MQRSGQGQAYHLSVKVWFKVWYYLIRSYSTSHVATVVRPL